MVPVETAWKAPASMPCCMLYPDMTDTDGLFSCFIARRTPTRSCPFSPLSSSNNNNNNSNVYIDSRSARKYYLPPPPKKTLFFNTHTPTPKILEHILTAREREREREREGERENLRKINSSPATSFFAVTKVLQPLVSKCRFGWPESMWFKY